MSGGDNCDVWMGVEELDGDGCDVWLNVKHWDGDGNYVYNLLMFEIEMAMNMVVVHNLMLYFEMNVVVNDCDCCFG